MCNSFSLTIFATPGRDSAGAVLHGLLVAIWMLIGCIALVPQASATAFHDAIDQLQTLSAKLNPDKNDFSAMAALIEKALALARWERNVNPELIDGLRRLLPDIYRDAGGGEKMFAAYLDYFGLLLRGRPATDEELDRVVRVVTEEYILAGTPERALEAFEPQLARPEFARTRDSSSAIVYRDMQRVLVQYWQLDLGITAGLRSLSHVSKVRSDAAPFIATLLNDLGFAYLSALRMPEAIDYLTQSLRMREEIDPNNLQEIGTTCQNLSNALYALGDIANARSYAERALEARRTALGEKHDKYAESLWLVAGLDPDSRKAISMLEQAREIYRVNDRSRQ
jgi:tetratricopeptide (TPR) repeat protein